MHDLVIEGARIVDGTGAPARHGNVAVADGRITGFFNQLNPSKLELRDLE